MYSIKNKTTEYSIMRKPPSVGTQSAQVKGRNHSNEWGIINSQYNI